MFETLDHLNFDIVSSFVFRASDFCRSISKLWLHTTYNNSIFFEGTCSLPDMLYDLIPKVPEQTFHRSNCAGGECAVSIPQMLAHPLEHGNMSLFTLAVFNPS